MIAPNSRCLNAVLGYAARGWHVVPLHGMLPDGKSCGCCKPECTGNSRGKHPQFPSWQERSSTDEDEIAGWCELWPNGNFGVQLGPKSGIIDIEFDDEEGKRTAEKLLGDCFTPSFQSGKSIHRLFQYTPELPDKAVHKVAGLEIRIGGGGNGAQSVFPPSVHHSGAVYAWLPGLAPDDVDVQPIPDSILALLANDPKGESLKPTAAEGGPPNWELLADAMKCLSADDYHFWVDAGQAIHLADPSLDGPGYRTWLAWSRTSSKFDEALCVEKWSGFNLNPPANPDKRITVGTLYFNATQAGWVRPPSKNTLLVSNAWKEKIDKETVTHAYSMQQIIEQIRNATGDWPRRVQNMLFAHEPGSDIITLGSASALTGYIGKKTGAPTVFHKAPHCHSASEVFSVLQWDAQSYVAVERYPHWPPLPGHYYAMDAPDTGDGKTLDKLVSRFSPATPIDSDLILAAFITPFWGGPGGTRPAFVFTAPEGRGVGKTTIAKLVAHLRGGHISYRPNDSVDKFVERILSPEGMTKGVVLLDNLKSLKFSNADLEGLITAPTLSGKRLYIGEGSRPNTLTYLITANGTSLATDMAQRSCIIELKRSKYAGDWEEKTFAFIEDNRAKLIADCIWYLRKPIKRPLSSFTRWGAWERDVLQRLPDAVEAQGVILERQGSADVELDESEIVEEFFKQRLAELEYSPFDDRIFVPSSLAATWFNTATKEKHTTTGVSRKLTQGIADGSYKRLEESKSRSYGRGFVWVGEHASPDTTARHDVETRIASKQGNREWQASNHWDR